jgi:hypothetical protein
MYRHGIYIQLSVNDVKLINFNKTVDEFDNLYELLFLVFFEWFNFDEWIEILDSILFVKGNDAFIRLYVNIR